MWIQEDVIIHPKKYSYHNELYFILSSSIQYQKSCVVALDDALEMVWNGKITDLETIIGLLCMDRHYKDNLF